MRAALPVTWVRTARSRPACPTLAAFLAYWLPEVVKPNLAPATYVSYEMFSRLYLVPDLGGRRLDRLQLSGVQQWINRISETCQCCRQGRDAGRPPPRPRCCAIGKCCQHLPSGSTVKDLRAQRIGRQLVHRQTKTEESDGTLPLVELCVAALKIRREAQEIARGRGR